MLDAMYADVVDLRDFYATRLGQVVRRMVRRRVRLMWPDVHGMRVMGLGYAAPYLRLFSDEAERVLGMMPAEQGVLAWPPDGPNCIALSEEGELPLQDYSVDRVLLVHALEYSEHARLLLRECWRVLAGGATEFDTIAGSETVSSGGFAGSAFVTSGGSLTGDCVCGNSFSQPSYSGRPYSLIESWLFFGAIAIVTPLTAGPG